MISELVNFKIFTNSTWDYCQWIHFLIKNIPSMNLFKEESSIDEEIIFKGGESIDDLLGRNYIVSL